MSFDKKFDDEMLDETELENLVEETENTIDEAEEINNANVEELVSQNAELKNDYLRAYAELKNDYLRAYAELENAKKRFQQELEKSSKYAISSFAKELLSVADNLHRALKASEGIDEANCQSLRTGVEMTESELMKVFAKFGVTKMEIIGQVFNPSYHQVIQEVEDKTKPAGTIVEELQTGYMINDRILRDAMVIVSK